MQGLEVLFARIELNLILDTPCMSAPLNGLKLIQQNAVRHMLFPRGHDCQVISKQIDLLVKNGNLVCNIGEKSIP